AGRGLIETAIGQLKEICQIQHHGIACQTISWQTSFSGLLAYVFKPDKPSISRKIGSRAYSLRQTEVKNESGKDYMSSQIKDSAINFS
ncbi:MAG: transposase, partial [Candidatus Midichloria mitochondrii]|nr:transposase [Candidatus Midichloria mitochondrii]